MEIFNLVAEIDVIRVEKINLLACEYFEGAVELREKEMELITKIGEFAPSVFTVGVNDIKATLHSLGFDGPLKRSTSTPNR